MAEPANIVQWERIPCQPEKNTRVSLVQQVHFLQSKVLRSALHVNWEVYLIPLQVPAFPVQLAITLDQNLYACSVNQAVTLHSMAHPSVHLAQSVSQQLTYHHIVF